MIILNNFSRIFSLLSLLFIIILSVVVLINSRKLVNKLFFLLTLILDLWVFGSFMMLSSTADAQVIFWDRFIYAAVVFWPALQYHFSLAVTYINKKRRITLAVAYLLSPVFLVLSQTDYFVKDVFRYAWGAHTQAQFLHHFFVLFFAVYGLLFFYNMIKQYRREHFRVEKKRLLYYVLGFCVLDFIGGTAFFPAYLIPFFPVFLATPLIFSLIISYAIVFFGLMDIKLIMRRYFVYTVSLVSVLAPTYLCLYDINAFYPRYLFPASLIIFAISLAFFARIKNYFYKFSNKHFFSSLYDFNELIYNLNNRLRASLDIKQIFQSTITILGEAFHSKAIAVISYEKKADAWSVVLNNGFDFKRKNIPLKYKLVSEVFSSNTPLGMASLFELFGSTNRGTSEYLEKIGVELMLPIKIKQSQLVSFMIFGQKESGETYNSKDLRVLESVAAEIGISLENALLYQSVTKFNVKLKDEINKATKQLQKQNEELTILDKAKTEFVGIASHQLRTPLTGIRWFTELLMQNKEKNLNEEQLDFLEQVDKSNHRMISLVNDLLDVTHIETGRKFDIIKAEFKLDDTIQEVIKENVALLTTKKLTIVNKISAKLKIYADSDKIKQVWQNLISNATKYTNEGKSIALSVDENDAKDYIFCVKDEGIGIPKDQQGQIFAKFFRANNATLQESDGTGLGLYIAREIIRAHGGEMWFESEEGKGTKFYFSLPKNVNNKIK